MHRIHEGSLIDNRTLHDPVKHRFVGVLLKDIQDPCLGIQAVVGIVAFTRKGVSTAHKDGRSIKQQCRTRHDLFTHKRIKLVLPGTQFRNKLPY